ncbi:MAG TPA: superoxide dismutase [Gemmataceae bacterium]
MAHTVPPLPYPYEALEPHIDKLTMQIHHDKHHQAYVDNLNKAISGKPDLEAMAVEDLLRNIKKVPEDIRQAVINNGGGHANHTLFWQIMKPNGGGEPSGELAEAIKSAFGDFAKFQEVFTNNALTQFGSGWSWLVWDGSKLAAVKTPNQDSPLMVGQTPLLGCDVWEHAYYLKYQNKRADYVKAWWNTVNWDEVARRFAAAKSGK